MSSLYDMTLEFNHLLYMAEAEAENADVSEETVLVDMLSEAGMAIDDKCDNIISYIKELTVEANALKEESNRLKLRAQYKANRIASLKGYLVDAGITKYESTAGVIRASKSAATVIDNEELIPAIYFNVKETKTVDKTMIKKAIKSGVEVKGAHIENRESVVVK